jgi:hypothetical protein
LAVLILALLVTVVVAQGIARPIIWEIPEGYEGWILAQFSDSSCAPLRSDGIFQVISVDIGGRTCTSSELPHGWQYVRFDAVGPAGRSEIDGSRVIFWSVSQELHRKTLFVGPRDRADPQQLPTDWR